MMQAAPLAYMSNTSLAPVPDMGEKAPDFELPDVDQNWRKLSDFMGKKTIVAFFPAAESPVCTAEMCAFRDQLDELRDYGANIVGISVDSPHANKAFTQAHHLNFPVLSDYKRDTISRYGIVMSRLGTMEGYNAAKRSVFILDEDGKVIYKWISDNPSIEPKYDEIKEVLRKAKK
jgi:glutaredoxin-dependent peroxiredoxin